MTEMISFARDFYLLLCDSFLLGVQYMNLSYFIHPFSSLPTTFQYLNSITRMGPPFMLFLILLMIKKNLLNILP